jgi:hypothetical protein
LYQGAALAPLLHIVAASPDTNNLEVLLRVFCCRLHLGQAGNGL